MTLKHWKSEAGDDGIAWLCIDKADGGANVLSGEVLEELHRLIEPMAKQPPKGVVIHSGKSNGFVMGADINEFTKIENPNQAYDLIRLGQQVLDELEALPCPTVAAINGFALGGGLELAMACDYRVALETDKRILGLPEVQLGIHPGFGGTVRAVQIAGVRPAMQLMLTGKPITVGKGRKIGLVDKVTDADGWRDAARELIASRPAKQTAPLVERLLNLPIARPFIRNVLIKQVAGKARKEHYPAPYAIIDLWSRHGASTRTGYEAEARSIAELMCTSTSRNLVRVFFLQNKLKGQGGKSATRISHVHVVGAGVMGGDIAAWCALRGHTVTLQDREQKYIDPAMERAAKLFEKRIRNDADRAAATERLQSDVEGAGAARADLVIEAIFENLEAKQALYKELQKKMPAGALLATNTSSIRLEDLRAGLEEPKRFIGLHFFNPVAQLPLVEVIRCEDTEQEALDTGFGFVKGIGKLPLECMSSPGFVVNRILAPYMAEAMELAESGVPLPEIDRAAEAFGMPMGPVELVDSVGIDVALHVSKVLGAAMNRPVPQKLADMVEAGQLGRKSGQGFYRWENGKAVKPAAGEGGAGEDVQDRLILPMVNEAIACLHDGVVSDDGLLDAGVIFGTGFAPFRGGPINYARERGIDEVVARLNEFTQRYGERFTPHEGFSKI
ncbi:MAG TPA: 3-hydroxyacyl-CoA dehydrogenase NAD-binding domain-containing protein [Woeseiaceae bacterium]|nr:3-hydroxyacyl-CoA dehydrogenase NAD-binding domain-containing protein [Woeseiaceae bacterium]